MTSYDFTLIYVYTFILFIYTNIVYILLYKKLYDFFFIEYLLRIVIF